MASLFPSRSFDRNPPRYDKRISTQVACALVVFALLQIVIVAKMGGSLLLHFGIFAAIACFAMGARTLEHRWARLAHSGLPAAGLETRYRRDLLQLWGASLVAPFLWIPVATVTGALFGH